MAIKQTLSTAWAKTSLKIPKISAHKNAVAKSAVNANFELKRDLNDEKSKISPEKITPIILFKTLFFDIISLKILAEKREMQKIITLREADMLDFYAFTLFYSKKARTQYAFNVFGIFGEAMIAGFVLDMFLKTQIFTILGVAFSVLWVIFYPAFLKNKRKAALAGLSAAPRALKRLNFSVESAADGRISYFDEAQENPENFAFSRISEIYELKNIFIIFIDDKIHLIIPKDADTAKMISLVAKNAKKHILKYENLEFSAIK